MKFHIKRSSDKQYYALIIARNGKILFTSETYKRKRNAIKACRVINDGIDIVDKCELKN